jgi:hypothetical protein
MTWAQTVRFVNLCLGAVMMGVTFRVVKEQIRRGWGEKFQYLRFFALGGWCFVFATTVVDRANVPLTWRSYATTVLLIISVISVHGIRRQQRAIPPTGARHPRHSGHHGTAVPGDPAWPQE